MTSGAASAPPRPGNLQAQRAATIAIGPAHDALEQEADQVAERITASASATPGASGAPALPAGPAAPARSRTPATHTPSAGPAAVPIQAARPQIQRACSSCGDEPPATVQAKRGDAPAAPATLRAVPNALRRQGGEPLSTPARRYFEPRFGRDFSEVRVHDHPAARQASRQLGARAFTLGADIAFAPGEYRVDTESGRRLLAHELTHVVQQAGGRRADSNATLPPLQAVAPRIQADGQMSPEEIAAIRRWLDADAGVPPAPGSQYFPDPGARTFPRFGATPTGMPAFGATGATAGLASFGAPTHVAAPAGTCPGGCHSINEALRAQAEERAQQARTDERNATWAPLVEQQHAGDLAQQAKTLAEDVQASEIAAAQQRLQLFDRALAAPSRQAGSDLPPAAAATLTTEMRDSWISAQQASIVLEALLASAQDKPIPAAVTAPLGRAYNAYYAALSHALLAVDIEEQRRLLGVASKLGTGVCPGNCHQPTGSGPFGPQSHAPSALDPDLLDPGKLLLPAASRPQPLASRKASGERSQHLEDAMLRASLANTAENWRAVIADFRWATTRMDEIMRARLQAAGGSCDLVAQFDFSQQLLERQREFRAAHPKAEKVQAVFYPRHDFVKNTDAKTGETSQAPKAMPWQFYLVRTETPDPYSRDVPPSYEWQLHDITAPIRENGRSVKTRTSVGGMIGAFAHERLDPRPIGQMSPPPQLFEELNSADFFPVGKLYWQLPETGTHGMVEMTAPTPFGVWLERIGMALVIIGSLVFAPMSTPMLISVLGGTALTIAGRAVRLEEMERHGIATPSDYRRFYWDVALDIVSALTLGLGKAVEVGRVAGTALRGAATLERAYFIVRRAQIAMNVVNIGVMTYDMVEQFRAIQNSNMMPDEKAAALLQLSVFAFGSGALAIVSLRSDVRSLSEHPRLRIGPDPGKAGALVADIETEAAGEAASHLRTRAQDNATIVERTNFTHPVSGETHSYALWSDGRITRCSKPPCLQLAESVVERINGLSDAMLDASAHTGDVQSLLARARKVREDAERLANGPAAKLAQEQKGLMDATQQIEADMAKLEHRVATENASAESNGRIEAETRYGKDALDYDKENYRWVRRRDGELEFQRRSQAVPWREFDPQTKTFKVTRTLFVAVPPERQQQLRESSATAKFPVSHTIDNVADLHRLRPASQFQTQLPKDWVVVRINDDNLVQFYTEAIPHGTIFEYPDGSRVWRTPQNTIASEGAVRAPIGRRGFEQSTPPQLQGAGADSNGGVPVIESTGVEHQRAHPRGQGTGFEMYNHIPLAPTYVNQELQARGIELYVDELRKAHPDLDLRLSTEHALVPDTRRQAWITYQIEVAGAGGRRPLLSAKITTDYTNPLKPAKATLSILAKTKEDLDIVMSVDMDAARSELEARIIEARDRRKQ